MSDSQATVGRAAPLLEMRGITKRFGVVTALAEVQLAVQAGEIHALVGENGAGKSTLMKVLSGVFAHGEYEGQIRVDDHECRFAGVADSERAGIGIIHQELALVPSLSITENIFLGHEPARWGVVDAFAAHAQARALLRRVGLDQRPGTLVGELGVGQQQLVEIAKALSRQVRLLILDEPTASLNETDSAALLQLLRGLKAQGIACILISHKLNEIAQVADAVTVLRDGRTVHHIDCRAKPADEDEIVQAMVGRPLAERYPRRTPAPGDTVFELVDWRVHHPAQAGRLVVKGVSLQARRGEIVGIAGLMGAGRTELAMSVFGRSWGQRISGQVRLHGREVDVSTVGRAIGHGIAYVTEDRKGLGLVLDQDLPRNMTLANLAAVSRAGVVDAVREHQVAEGYRRQLQVRCAGLSQPVLHLSGGNQQKVVLAKWLFTRPEVLILDEPTRGIDVGAKFEIYGLVAELAAAGTCVLVISSELPELLGLCDRLYVMNEGRIVGEFNAADATQEKIMRCIVTAEAA